MQLARLLLTSALCLEGRPVPWLPWKPGRGKARGNSVGRTGLLEADAPTVKALASWLRSPGRALGDRGRQRGSSYLNQVCSLLTWGTFSWGRTQWLCNWSDRRSHISLAFFPSSFPSFPAFLSFPSFLSTGPHPHPLF